MGRHWVFEFVLAAFLSGPSSAAGAYPGHAPDDGTPSVAANPPEMANMALQPTPTSGRRPAPRAARSLRRLVAVGCDPVDRSAVAFAPCEAEFVTSPPQARQGGARRMFEPAGR